MHQLFISAIVALVLSICIVGSFSGGHVFGQGVNTPLSMSVGFVKSKALFHIPGQYDAKTLGIASASDFCPNGGCQFQLSNGQISNLEGSNQLTFNGVLKVKKGGISKLYNFYDFLTVTQEQNIDGKKIQTLEGTIDFGHGDVVVANPDFSYKIKDATFTTEGKKGTLVINAERGNELDTIQSTENTDTTETTEATIPETPSQQSEPLQTSNTTSSNNNIIYGNPDYKIEILHPSNWKVNENQLPAHAIVMFDAPVSGNNVAPANVLIANYQLSNNNNTLDDFINLFFKDRYASPSDYEIINTENTTLDGLKAKRFTMYDYNKTPVSGLSSTVKVMRILAVDNKSNGYAVKYESDPGTFDKYFVTAQQMMNSLRLNKDVSPVNAHVVNMTIPIQPPPFITNSVEQYDDADKITNPENPALKKLKNLFGR